jgi:aqualysin 1
VVQYGRVASVPDFGRGGENSVRRIALLIVLTTASTLLLAGAAFTQAPEREEDTDPYIVVLEESVDNPAQVAEGIEGRQEGLDVGLIYGAAIEGFSAEIPDGSVDEVRNNPKVDFVERNQVIRVEEQKVPWGIEEIGATRSSTRAGDGTGTVEGVNVYVIDTGIDVDHSDLEVVEHHTWPGFQGNAAQDNDCDGHGTHVAGTLAAIDNDAGVVGVAPGAPLTGVKVFDCRGKGTTESLVWGVNWVTAAEATNPTEPAVANLSLSGPMSSESRAINQSVKNSVRSGIFYSLAAGNQYGRACRRSPARVGGSTDGAVTTAAIRESGVETSYSNFGRCVDLWAPGNGILSTKLGGGTIRDSGTSMATPHVGGTAALYLSNNQDASPERVENVLKRDAILNGEKSKDGRRIKVVNAEPY